MVLLICPHKVWYKNLISSCGNWSSNDSSTRFHTCSPHLWNTLKNLTGPWRPTVHSCFRRKAILSPHWVLDARSFQACKYLHVDGGDKIHEQVETTVGIQSFTPFKINHDKDQAHSGIQTPHILSIVSYVHSFLYWLHWAKFWTYLEYSHIHVHVFSVLVTMNMGRKCVQSNCY